MHNLSIAEVLNRLKTDENNGLTLEQVSQIRKEHGENKLKEKKKKSIFVKFIEQFKDVMIIILLLASTVFFLFLLAKE